MRLMIDVKATREAFERKEIDNVSWTRSEYNVADGSTKVANCEALDKVLEHASLNLHVEQWIVMKELSEDMDTGKNISRISPQKNMYRQCITLTDTSAFIGHYCKDINGIRGRGTEAKGSSQC